MVESVLTVRWTDTLLLGVRLTTCPSLLLVRGLCTMLYYVLDRLAQTDDPFVRWGVAGKFSTSNEQQTTKTTNSASII